MEGGPGKVFPVASWRCCFRVSWVMGPLSQPGSLFIPTVTLPFCLEHFRDFWAGLEFNSTARPCLSQLFLLPLLWTLTFSSNLLTSWGSVSLGIRLWGFLGRNFPQIQRVKQIGAQRISIREASKPVCIAEHSCQSASHVMPNTQQGDKEGCSGINRPFSVPHLHLWWPLGLPVNAVWKPLTPSNSTFAAAAAKSLQSCPTLCDSIDGSPPGSSIPGILQARILEWIAVSFSNAWKGKGEVKSLSRVRLLATPWTAAYQAPPSMGFSRQECWSGLPLPCPTRLLHTADSQNHPRPRSQE